jgi:hypothetical protein
LFILFNIVGVLVGKSFQETAAGKFFYPYLVWTRLLQQWNLFVPAPRKHALKYRVDITFQDGTHATWRRPYPPNWAFFERHLAYHFQRWDLATTRLEQPGVLWPDLVAFIERLYHNDRNPPVEIALVREFAYWPPPKKSGYVMPELSDLEWSELMLFRYDVKARRFTQ